MWYYCVACTEIRPGYAEPFNCARCFSCFLEEHEGIIPPKSNRMAGCGRLIPDGLTVAELDMKFGMICGKRKIKEEIYTR